MTTKHSGRQYQDSVFRLYFNDPDRLREVAGALHQRAYPSEEHIQIVTLQGTFLSQLKNDISFLLGGRCLILIEHQITLNQNMALRCLYYVCEQLRQTIAIKDLHRNRRIPLPAPEFHVFYTGETDLPETQTLRLSDAYLAPIRSIHLELSVLCHNIEYSAEKPLLKKSRALKEYSFFIGRIKANLRQGMARPDAIREAVLYCETHAIMAPFLKAHEREVIDMVNFEWNQKEYEAAIREDGMEKGMEKGRQEGMEKGRQEEKTAIILNMLREKLPVETIAKISNFSVEKVNALGKMHSLL